MKLIFLSDIANRREETSACIDGFISHELQELRKRKLF